MFDYIGVFSCGVIMGFILCVLLQLAKDKS